MPDGIIPYEEEKAAEALEEARQLAHAFRRHLLLEGKLYQNSIAESCAVYSDA